MKVEQDSQCTKTKVQKLCWIKLNIEPLPEHLELIAGEDMGKLINKQDAIDKIKKETLINYSVAVMADVVESAKRRDAPIYEEDKENPLVRLADVENAINKYLNIQNLVTVYKCNIFTRIRNFFRLGDKNMNCEEQINKIIKLLQSPDLDDYECCIEIAKVVGVYNYEREDKRE